VPPVLTRLTNTVSVAREIWLAVSPAGNVLRSNCSSAVLPFPTYRLASVPKLVVERVMLTCASPVRATSVACAAEQVKNADTEKATRRPIEQSFKRTLLLRSMLTDKKGGQEYPQDNSGGWKLVTVEGCQAYATPRLSEIVSFEDVTRYTTYGAGRRNLAEVVNSVSVSSAHF